MPKLEFPTTNWSIIAMMKDSPDRAAIALESFCDQYRQPMLQFLSSLGLTHNDNEDILHDFLMQLILKERFTRIEAENGRLRSFLMVCLRNFAFNELTKRNCQKRGGGKEFISLDSVPNATSLSVDHRNQELIFDREWANTVMEAVLENLELEYAQRNRTVWFDTLSVFLYWDPSATDYSKPAEKLGIATSRVSLEVFRLRKRFQRLLRQEIARTVQNLRQIEDELRYLAQVLG